MRVWACACTQGKNAVLHRDRHCGHLLVKSEKYAFSLADVLLLIGLQCGNNDAYLGFGCGVAYARHLLRQWFKHRLLELDLCGDAEAVRVELLPVFHERNASQYKSLQLVARLFKALEIRAARLRSFNDKRDAAVYRLGAFHADAHRKLAVLIFKLHGLEVFRLFVFGLLRIRIFRHGTVAEHGPVLCKMLFLANGAVGITVDSHDIAAVGNVRSAFDEDACRIGYAVLVGVKEDHVARLRRIFIGLFI